MHRLKLAMVAVLGASLFLASASTAFAGPRHYQRRLHDPKVNTRAEAHFDANGNGVIGPRERRALIHHRRKHRHHHRHSS